MSILNTKKWSILTLYNLFNCVLLNIDCLFNQNIYCANVAIPHIGIQIHNFGTGTRFCDALKAPKPAVCKMKKKLFYFRASKRFFQPFLLVGVGSLKNKYSFINNK